MNKAHAASEPVVGKAHRVKAAVLQGAFLLGVWVILSGKFDAFHLGAGIASVVLLLWLHRRLAPLHDRGHIHFHPLRWLIYVVWLIGQTLLGAIHVAGVIIAPSRRLNPRLIRVRMPQPNIFATVALANSITVTPGTLTVDVVDDVFEVHALTDETARGLLTGSMPERVARLFADTAPPAPTEVGEDTNPASRLPLQS